MTAVVFLPVCSPIHLKFSAVHGKGCLEKISRQIWVSSGHAGICSFCFLNCGCVVFFLTQFLYRKKPPGPCAFVWRNSCRGAEMNQVPWKYQSSENTGIPGTWWFKTSVGDLAHLFTWQICSVTEFWLIVNKLICKPYLRCTNTKIFCLLFTTNDEQRFSLLWFHLLIN